MQRPTSAEDPLAFPSLALSEADDHYAATGNVSVHLTDVTIEIFPNVGWQIPADALLFVDIFLCDFEDQSTMQTLGPLSRESEWTWKLTESLEINTNVTSGMLVGYITDVPETFQIGSVNLDESSVVSIRFAPNQRWSDTLRDSDDKPTSKIMGYIEPAPRLNEPRWLIIGNTFQSRFEHTGLLNQLDQEIMNGQLAVLLTPNAHPRKSSTLSSLGLSFHLRFESTGIFSDIEEAINNHQQAVFLTPDGHPEKPEMLSLLGNSFYRRFEHTGMLSDLEEAIKNGQLAVTLTPDGDSMKPGRLNNLGNPFRARFESTGLLSDLEKALENLQQALLLAPDGHPDKGTILSHLGSILRLQFEHTGALSVLDEAIKNGQQAVLVTPERDPGKPRVLNNLGTSFMRRFGWNGMLTDVEEAIKNLQQAVPLIPDGHPLKPQILINLGTCFESWYNHTGVLSVIEEAIKNFHQAMLLTPDGHPQKPGIFGCLASSFGFRFDHTEVLDDLEESIKNARQALSFTPDGHYRLKSRIYLSLVNSLYRRFERTRMFNDLEDATHNCQQALLLTPDGHPEGSSHLANLGKCFRIRYQETGVPSDLDQAIEALQQATLLVQDMNPVKVEMLCNLGISFLDRFQCTKTPSDIEEAIKNCEQAVLLTPDGHATQPLKISNLGTSFFVRFMHTKSMSDRDQAVSHFRSAATSNIGSPLHRFRSAQKWARLTSPDPSSALVAYRRAMDLIPQMAWIGDPIGARYSRIKEIDDFPREAAAITIHAGKPDLALEWLELGRSVIWNQLLNFRTPVDELRQSHPDICAEFTQVSYELQSAATRERRTEPYSHIQISLEQETQRHHRLAEKWDSLVEQIRLLPDFGHFLLPKTISVLKKAAESGPVVVINVYEARCDALVLEQSRNDVHLIPLKDLSCDELEKMRKFLRKELVGGEHRGSEVAGGSSGFERVLSKLYTKIVHPILQELGLTRGRTDSLNLPRIWWCPTGVLTFLPLHAAGREIAGGREETSNYVVSSYIPTVNALLEARAAKRPPFNQLVGIAMVNTPYFPSLPDAATELTEIGKLFPADSRWRFEALQNEQATGERVLTKMENSSWMHLACHAVQDVQEPVRSGLCLHDKRLMIRDIIDKPFTNADFAFLSACETASGNEEVSDEAMHITGAMLGAGYRSVIGTMWSIPDAAAPVVAKKVYENLMSEGEPESNRSAQALHEGVKELRKSGMMHSIYSWVPFVHYGR